MGILEKVSIMRAMTDKIHEKSRKSVRHECDDGQKSWEPSYKFMRNNSVRHEGDDGQKSWGFSKKCPS